MTGPELPSAGDRRLQDQHGSLWSLGTRMIQAGRWAEATDQFLRIVEIVPTDAAAMVQASHLLSRLDRYREAHALAMRAARIERPIQAEAAVQIAKLLRRFEEPEQLQALFVDTNWRDCRSAQLLTEAARLLMTSGLHAEALAMVDRAIVVDQHYPHAHYLHGSMLAAAGDQEGARASLQRASSLEPGAPHVHWMLSWQPSGADTGEAAAEALVIELRERIRHSAPGSDARAYLAYALHNRLHRLQRYDDSWQALASGMQAKRIATPYRPEAQRQLFDALHAMPLPRLPDVASSPGEPRPIFIVGMHRSGTTLLEHLLAGHSTVADGGETYTFTAQVSEATDHHCSGVIDATALGRLDSVDWQSLGDGFRAYARWRAGGRAALTEKLPSNFLNMGLIARALPEARFLHMRRDPVDVCFSNLRTFFGQAAAYSYDQEQLAGYYLQYQRLMTHWHAHFSGRILDIDYAALVRDPEAQMRRVMAFCGLDFEPGAMDVGRGGGSVATASMADIRGGIRKDRGGAWRPYAARLQPLLEALRPAYVDAPETD